MQMLDSGAPATIDAGRARLTEYSRTVDLR
jgi:hypothetical protein